MSAKLPSIGAPAGAVNRVLLVSGGVARPGGHELPLSRLGHSDPAAQSHRMGEVQSSSKGQSLDNHGGTAAGSREPGTQTQGEGLRENGMWGPRTAHYPPPLGPCPLGKRQRFPHPQSSTPADPAWPVSASRFLFWTGDRAQV